MAFQLFNYIFFTIIYIKIQIAISSIPQKDFYLFLFLPILKINNSKRARYIKQIPNVMIGCFAPRLTSKSTGAPNKIPKELPETRLFAAGVSIFGSI